MTDAAFPQSSPGARRGRPVRAVETTTVLLPRADRLVWIMLALLMLAGGGGLALGVWWMRQPVIEPAVIEMRIGQRLMAIPPAYLGPRAAENGREVGMARFRVTWPDMAAAPLGDKAEVHLTLRPADPTTDPQAQFAKLARFLTGGAWSNPGGLVARSFKKGSPFEADELYMSLPDGKDFFARCTAEVGPHRMDEGCRTVIKHQELDIILRFPREALTEWQALADGAKALVDRFTRS
jgi:hypothetical protein